MPTFILCFMNEGILLFCDYRTRFPTATEQLSGTTAPSINEPRFEAEEVEEGKEMQKRMVGKNLDFFNVTAYKSAPVSTL